VLFDMGLPLVAVIGYRSALVPNSTDTACRFTEPILQAWGLDYVVIRSADELPRMADHLRHCLAAGEAGIVLVAEGRM
jgi:hypothetical protein